LLGSTLEMLRLLIVVEQCMLVELVLRSIEDVLYERPGNKKIFARKPLEGVIPDAISCRPR